ncbi:ATP-binding protein [Pseudoalteromonas sp. N1230-9]|uniref:sensor histidine kinase n=1 Tax=Pseudoalteromonas sp. N1230-9 TaxID=2907156 RepID=UPI002B2A31F3|nr:ATP-binding protein [Pseudoalteromonas sp. N1230-9]
MAKIPFEVSARAARLIGRENVSSVEGAITELVKNTYDADATSCILLLLPVYKNIPELIKEEDFVQLNEYTQEALKKYYSKRGESYVLVALDEEQRYKLVEILKEIVEMWIIDNGHGMCSDTIKKNWMVIGTDNKETSSKSPKRRVVNGAKGIGRFALDRLGNKCDLFSHSEKGLIHWQAKWSDFEGRGKVLGDVEADLDSIKDCDLQALFMKYQLEELIPLYEPSDKAESTPINFSTGTAINISFMRDRWTDKSFKILRRTLSSLIPPKEQKDFNIYLYDARTDDSSDCWIERDIPDECDYSISASVDHTGDVLIKIGRHEFDVSQITPTLFTLDQMKEDGFSKEDLEKGYFSYNKALSELLKIDNDEVLADYMSIGPFSLNLYFFKLKMPTKENLKRFPYKNYDTKGRAEWLSNSGGIRLYRDNFRVRPYGEPETHAYDWLLLGQRVASNPAAVTRIGGWKVAPQNIAGTINISKDTNPLLGDQSNREGIANPGAFSLFTGILKALINEFERDRSIIFHHLDQAYKIDNPEEEKKKKGKSAATKARFSGGQGMSPEQVLDMAQTIEINEAEKKELRDDNQLLRGLATLGTVLVSFSHELKQIQAGMNNRTLRMAGALNKVVDEEKLGQVSQSLNPYNMLERWQREDSKVSHWVDFALSSVKAKKRRRRLIELNDYFDNLAGHWQNYLKDKKTELTVNKSVKDELSVMAHEIDLDSVFFNLIINSVEIFTNPKAPWIGPRNITIEVKGVSQGYITLEYHDSGPGISKSFRKPEDIFIYGESTKNTGDDDGGTGIGMWIMKTIVDDYKGKVIIKNSDTKGFHLRIDFPIAE